MEHHTRIGLILDPHTRTSALPEATDDELIIAAISRNAESIYPGMDEIIAANDLALLVLNTKSPNGFERVMREALRWVSAQVLIDAITSLHDSGNISSNNDAIQQLLEMPNGQLAVSACCAALADRKWLRAENDLLERLIAVSTDIPLLEEVAKHGTLGSAARSRLMVLDPLAEATRTDLA